MVGGHRFLHESQHKGQSQKAGARHLLCAENQASGDCRPSTPTLNPHHALHGVVIVVLVTVLCVSCCTVDQIAASRIQGVNGSGFCTYAMDCSDITVYDGPWSLPTLHSMCVMVRCDGPLTAV